MPSFRLPLRHAVCLIALATAAPAIASALAPEPAEARAGGSYGSSSSSSARSSSSRSSFGSSSTRSSGYRYGSSSNRYRSGQSSGFKDLMAFIFALALVVIGGMVLLLTSKRTAGAPAPYQQKKNAADLTGEMARRDPVWQEANLLQQARDAYMAVQRAWVQRDQQIASAVMTPEFLATQKRQTDGMLARGERNVLENLAITGVRIVHASDYLDDHHDEAWVKISARAVDYLIQESTGRVLKGKRDEICHFTEIWKFRRANDTWLVFEIEANAHAHIPESFVEAPGA